MVSKGTLREQCPLVRTPGRAPPTLILGSLASWDGMQHKWARPLLWAWTLKNNEGLFFLSSSAFAKRCLNHHIKRSAAHWGPWAEDHTQKPSRGIGTETHQKRERTPPPPLPSCCLRFCTYVNPLRNPVEAVVSLNYRRDTHWRKPATNLFN